MGLGCSGGGLLWLVLASGALWGQASCQAPPQGLRFLSYEVIIPRRMAPRRGREPQDLAYLLELEGKGHVVHLRQKRGFVPKHFPIFSYSRAGDLQVDYPFLRDDCFYHGFVQDKPSSLVSLSTCSGGLRGLLQMDGRIYEIEPAQASAGQHVVYRLGEKEGTAEGTARMSCGLMEEEQRRQVAMIQNTENGVSSSVLASPWKSQPRYVKIAVVVEHEWYVQLGSNETAAARQVLDAAHIVDSLYKPLGVHVAVVGLELWSQRNLITITKSIDELLQMFNTWRKTILLQRLRHDVGHLFVYKRFGAKFGLSFIGTVCDPTLASAVESFITSSLFSFSITFAHQLGHNLGMLHDGKDCTCDQHSCIMASVQNSTSKFSSCSYDSYFNLINSDGKHCLFIPPDHEKLYEPKNCGNNVVESGEQCDCGSEYHCDSDACCQSNCMLRTGATCAFGTCCANCQFISAGTLCRERTTICDLPEYCTGFSEFCPEDVYVQDGTPCYGDAYCYHGKCSTHDEQCKSIFGEQAVVAPLNCFTEINTRGDRFGNCGTIPGNIYKKCENRNVLCGRVQCINIDEVPNLNEHSTIIQTSLSNSLCWGTNYPTGIGMADTGAVRDGTQCGSGMICIDNDCIKVSLLNYDCNQTKCHNRGICNSHKNCHCDFGWAPPYCRSEGYGGSIDSGPPSPNSGNVGIISGIVRVFPVIVVSGTAIGFV